MVDREYGISSLQQGFSIRLDMALVVEDPGLVSKGSCPTAARDLQNGISIRLLGIVDIHDQCQSGVHAVDNIPLDRGRILQFGLRCQMVDYEDRETQENGLGHYSFGC